MELTKNHNWLNAVRTFKEATNNCIETVYLNTPGVKAMRLDRNFVSKEIKISLCSDILIDAKVRNYIDKKLYTLLENKISEFENYLEQNKDQKLSIERHFENWAKRKENYSHKMYKEFISKRIKQKRNFRGIASEN